MLEPLDSSPIFGEPTRADAILAACDGRDPYVPHAADREGLARTAHEIAEMDFPRDEISRVLVEYNLRIGAPAEAVENARRLAGARALAVAAGQQPMAAGGPLYVLYKAATAVRLAREAEAALGVPVVPVFWNASEDHDIDEVALARAPARSAGAGGLLRLKADLEPWRGRPLHAIGPDARWRAPVAEWLGAVSSETVELFTPREDEGWSIWFSRILASVLGRHGLVLLEPHLLRPCAGEIFARAVLSRREIAGLIDRSCAERVDLQTAPNFSPSEGPPLFLEHEGRRRRVVADGGRLALRGTEVTFEPEELARLAREEPARFSSHAVLRPVVQNRLLPVVAEVLGPGEFAYHEELFRFHLSDLGAGRRPPVLWPRLSATVLDRRTESTLGRFGIGYADMFLPEEDLLNRFTPGGVLADDVRAASGAAAESLAAVRERVLALDGTLERPLRKTMDTVARAFGTFADKVAAAEATVRGFAPEKLRRLSAWVRPGGRPQERVFAFAAVLASAGRDFVSKLTDEMDVFDHRHMIVHIPEGAA